MPLGTGQRVVELEGGDDFIDRQIVAQRPGDLGVPRLAAQHRGGATKSMVSQVSPTARPSS
jgi:hypothetical protein